MKDHTQLVKDYEIGILNADEFKKRDEKYDNQFEGIKTNRDTKLKSLSRWAMFLYGTIAILILFFLFFDTFFPTTLQINITSRFLSFSYLSTLVSVILAPLFFQIRFLSKDLEQTLSLQKEYRLQNLTLQKEAYKNIKIKLANSEPKTELEKELHQKSF